MKTILTLEDLIQYCETNKLQSFSSSESGFRLAVRVPATFELEDEADFNHRGLMKLKFRIFHTGLNRNGSFVSKEAAEKAMGTIANRPILAYIHQLDNGEWDFKAHEMEEVITEDGEKEIHYIENQVGAFSSEPTFWEHDDKNDKDFVCAYGYIPRDYTKAAEIIERKGGTKNSCELYVDKMSYNAKEKYLELEEFYVNGSTLLGSTDDGKEIGEGMLGSRADIVDFKAEPEAFEVNTELIKVLENLNETLSHFDIKNLGKEVNEVKKKELEQTQEELFDLTDGQEPEGNGETGQETGGTQTEGGGTQTEGGSTQTEGGGTQTTGTETTGGTTGGETSGETGGTTDGAGDTPKIIDDGSDAEALKKISYTITTTDGAVREFNLSVSDKLNAAFNLVNSTYGAEDNDYYSVDMFEEEGYLEMYGWFTGKNYRQSFEWDNESLALTGERVEIFQMFLTAEEKNALESMKANYSEITDKLRKYEEEPQKMEILSSVDYEKVFSTEEFENLKLQKTHFDMSIDEVREKADAILLDYAKHSNFSIQTETTTEPSFVKIPIIQKKVSRYGNLFSNVTK